MQTVYYCLRLIKQAFFDYLLLVTIIILPKLQCIDIRFLKTVFFRLRAAAPQATAAHGEYEFPELNAGPVYENDTAQVPETTNDDGYATVNIAGPYAKLDDVKGHVHYESLKPVSPTNK